MMVSDASCWSIGEWDIMGNMFMWEAQCHKQLPFKDGLCIAPLRNGDDLGMVQMALGESHVSHGL